MSEIIAWLNQHPTNIGEMLTSIAVLVVAGLAISLLKRFMSNWLNSIQTRHQFSNRTISTIIRVVTGTLWLIAVLLILDAWGIGLAGLWGLLVSATAVIGVGFLATWSMVSNFTASFFLTIWQPFRLGDTVILLPENTEGRLTDRNLMFTVLREQDGGVINVPNNFFFQKSFRVVSSGETTLIS
jgi:small-conductance mechanosensitive channel